MRSIVFTLAFAISVSLNAMAQHNVAMATESQCSRDPSAAPALDRGNCWLKKGRVDRSIADYSLAIVFDAGHAGAYYIRGLARVVKGDLDGALRDFDKSLALNPRLVEALISRGLARCNNGEIAAGLADFSRAIELNPRDAGVWSNRGAARQQFGDIDAALEDYAEAIRLNHSLDSSETHRVGTECVVW